MFLATIVIFLGDISHELKEKLKEYPELPILTIAIFDEDQNDLLSHELYLNTMRIHIFYLILLRV